MGYASLTSEQALERLLAGNRRYVAMRQLHPRQTVLHRQRLVEGQHPFAAVLSCSDSRVPSELVFDQGLGDLFMVRTAGHALTDIVLASVEFAVYALRVPLIAVVGHAECGAIQAVLADRPLPGHLPRLIEALRPALATVALDAPDALDRAIRANSQFVAARLAADSEVIAEAQQRGEVRIVAAHYELGTGAVELLEPAAGGGSAAG